MVRRRPSSRLTWGRQPSSRFNFIDIQGITPVVPGSVRDQRDQAVKLPQIRPHLFQQAEQPLHQFQVGDLLPAADIIGLPHPALGQHLEQSLAMVLHKDPVPDIGSLGHKWEWAYLPGPG